MIITLITGEKVKVKESTSIIETISVDDVLLGLTVLETKLVKGEFKECETPIYFRIEHIVSYEEINA